MLLRVLTLVALFSSVASAHSRSVREYEQTVDFLNGDLTRNGFTRLSIGLTPVLSACSGEDLRVDVQVNPGGARRDPLSVYWYERQHRPLPEGVRLPSFPFPHPLEVSGWVSEGGKLIGRFRTRAYSNPIGDCGGEVVATLPPELSRTDEAIARWLGRLEVQFEMLPVQTSLWLDRRLLNESRASSTRSSADASSGPTAAEKRDRNSHFEENRRNAWSGRLARSRAVPKEEIADDLAWLKANTTTTHRFGRSDRTVTFAYTSDGINDIGWHELVQVSPTDTGRVEVKWMSYVGNLRAEYLTPRTGVGDGAVARRVYRIARKKGNDSVRLADEVEDRDAAYLAAIEGGKSYEQRVGETLVEGAFKVNWEMIASRAAQFLGDAANGYSITDLRLKLTTAPSRYARKSPLIFEVALPAMMFVTLPPHTYDPPLARALPGQFNVRFWAPGLGLQYRLVEHADYSGNVSFRLQVPINLHLGALMLPSSNDVGEETSDFRRITPKIGNQLRGVNFHANVNLSAQVILGVVGVGATVGLQYVNIAPSDDPRSMRFWTGEPFGTPGAYETSRFVMAEASPLIPYASVKLLLYFGGD